MTTYARASIAPTVVRLVFLKNPRNPLKQHTESFCMPLKRIAGILRKQISALKWRVEVIQGQPF